ncbi:MAG: hypothetical protein ACXWIO_05245 [Croceibacterium sp.]
MSSDNRGDTSQKFEREFGGQFDPTAPNTEQNGSRNRLAAGQKLDARDQESVNNLPISGSSKNGT